MIFLFLPIKEGVPAGCDVVCESAAEQNENEEGMRLTGILSVIFRVKRDWCAWEGGIKRVNTDERGDNKLITYT